MLDLLENTVVHLSMSTYASNQREYQKKVVWNEGTDRRISLDWKLSFKKMKIEQKQQHSEKEIRSECHL